MRRARTDGGMSRSKATAPAAKVRVIGLNFSESTALWSGMRLTLTFTESIEGDEVRGIATIERHTVHGTFAIWVTNRSGSSLEAANTNAVVIEGDDPLAWEKARSLTRCCAVLITPSTTLDGLPVAGTPLVLDDIFDLLQEIEKHQRRILDIVADYNRSRRTSLVPPDLPALPSHIDLAPPAPKVGGMALSVANFVGRGWSAWLKTDEQRRRRTVQPKTGTTPWVMPEDMNGAAVPDFPPGFAERLYVQPLV